MLVPVPVDAPISVVELFSYNPGTFVPEVEKETRFIKISIARWKKNIMLKPRSYKVIKPGFASFPYVFSHEHQVLSFCH